MDDTNAAAPPWMGQLAEDFPMAGTPAVGYYRTLTEAEQASFRPDHLATACAYIEGAVESVECSDDPAADLAQELRFVLDKLGVPHPDRLVAWLS